MRNLVRWMAGLAGIAALAKLVRARPRTVPALPPGEPTGDEPISGEPEGGDPAAELRRKLADARSGALETTDESAVAVASPDERSPEEHERSPEEPERSLEERRAEIHARAQDAIEAMRNDDA
jgi:hypothetical protein